MPSEPPRLRAGRFCITEPSEPSEPSGGLALRIRSQSDFWCGLLFLAVGVAVMLLAQQYRVGTAARMGPGFFPTLLGGLLAFLGLILAIPALLVDGERFPTLPLRPLVMVLVSIAVFGLALETLGFAAAVVMLVVVGGLADPESQADRVRGARAVPRDLLSWDFRGPTRHAAAAVAEPLSAAAWTSCPISPLASASQSA